jgi:hypothetical protein
VAWATLVVATTMDFEEKNIIRYLKTKMGLILSVLGTN